MPPASLPQTTVTIGTTTILVEVARTPASQEKGLSGRTSLEEGRGMLFVFDIPAKWGIWMSGMQFPIDVIWANEDGTISTIKENMTPDTYPEAFYPDEPALYVLELPGGFVALHNLAKGSKIVVK